MKDAADSPAELVVAADVCRGSMRLLAMQGWVVIPEVMLANGRRVDLMGLSPSGDVLVVEVKVSQADLLGDSKWRDYLPFCDRFSWAVPPFLVDLVANDPGRSEGMGLIVADRYGADWLHHAPPVAAAQRLAGARRKAVLLAFARQAGMRLMRSADPNGWQEVAEASAASAR